MVVLLDVPVLSLGVFTPYEVEAAGNSTSPPVTADKADDGLYDESDDWVLKVVHVLVARALPNGITFDFFFFCFVLFHNLD